MLANAQVGITGVPFLEIHPTAEGMMTGGASSASPSLNPATFFYNPAHLGHIGHNQAFSASGFYNPIDWLPRFNIDLTYNQRSATGGLNLSEQLPVPLSIGVGYLRSDLDYGEQIRTDADGNVIGTFTSSEHYNMFGIGLHLDYPIWITLGYSHKQIESRLLPKLVGRVKAYDAGIAVGYTHTYESLDAGINLSYVIRNVGDHIQYSNISQPDPLPRGAVIGYELSAGHTFRDQRLTLQPLRVDWTLEASDILAEFVNQETFERGYTRWPGNINFEEHVLLGKHDDQVTVRRGARFHFLETVTIGTGSFKGPGYPERIDTEGYIISSSGLLKLVNYLWDYPFLASIHEQLTITYANTRLIPREVGHPLSDTRYQEITVILTFF